MENRIELKTSDDRKIAVRFSASGALVDLMLDTLTSDSIFNLSQKEALRLAEAIFEHYKVEEKLPRPIEEMAQELREHYSAEEAELLKHKPSRYRTEYPNILVQIKTLDKHVMVMVGQNDDEVHFDMNSLGLLSEIHEMLGGRTIK